MRILFLIISIFIIVLGCQQKPTKVTVQNPLMAGDLPFGVLSEKNIVILDVRPAFEFNLSHAPGAINVQWDDFSQGNQKYKGLLQTDLYAAARRLSLIGIDPQTPVVVLGKGNQGRGEDGRIAWTLKTLGIEKVYTLYYKAYREMNTTKEAPAVQNKPYWKPQVSETLSVSYKVFRQKVLNPDHDTVVIDARSPQEYSLDNLTHTKNIKAQVYNFEWKNFFDDKGIPEKNINSRLSKFNINQNSKILVISSHGVRSAAVTYALNALGYTNVANFAGGYDQWRDR